MKRLYAHSSQLREGGYSRGSPRPAVPKSEANLITSKLADGRHAPALDIDHPCKLIPSSTKGHFHLYVDVPMSWFRYRVLLWALKFSGIIEPGYYGASVNRKATHLRKPGVRK